MARPVAVITALYHPNDEHLLACYRSLCEQKVPWRWVTQGDGERYRLPEEIASDSRVENDAAAIRLYAAGARNLALARAADSDYVLSFDHDDVLVPGALDRLVETLEATSEAAFAFGRYARLCDDGSEEEVENHLRPGLLDPGAMWQTLRERFVALQSTGLAGGGVLWRTEELLQLGGWPALGRSEDTTLLFRGDALFAKIVLDELTFLYRFHERQTIAQPWAVAEKRRSRQFATVAIDALQRSR
jgi:hypothetical protein